MGEWRSGSNLRHLPPPNMETAAGWGDCGEGGGDWGYGHLGTKGIAGRKLAKLSLRALSDDLVQVGITTPAACMAVRKGKRKGYL